MPKVKANNITMNYDHQGSGEPLILISYLAADYACYAFQVAEYAKHFTCVSIETPRGPTPCPSRTSRSSTANNLEKHCCPALIRLLFAPLVILANAFKASSVAVFDKPLR